MMDERTTELKRLKSGANFTWGRLIKIHEIGEYSIVEFYPWITENSTVWSGTPDTTKKEFTTYVMGKDCGRGFLSLDAAIVGCIAYKHDGINTRADYYFMKMIGTNND